MQFKEFKEKLKSKLPEPISFLLTRTWRFFFILSHFICDKSRVLIKGEVAYIHVYKVANISINKAMFFEEEKENKNKPYFKLTAQHRINTCQKPMGYYTFSFVRNPFDRLYSCYKNKCVDAQLVGKVLFDEYLYGYVRNITSFESFVKKIYLIPNPICEYHFKPQYNILYKHGKCIADYIGRFENLEKDFAPLRKKYGFGKLPRLNPSQKKR